MQHLVIIGGGFAGFWSAMSAIRQGRDLGKLNQLKITLISKDEYHGIRPRFYEPRLAGARIPLTNYLAPLKIDFVVDEVSRVDTENRRIFLTNSSLDIVYDVMILASGSQLSAMGIPGIERVYNVDTFEGASRLDQHLHNLSAMGFPTQASRNFVVVGGGFTGLEVITSLPQRIKALAPTSTVFNFYLIERSSELALNYSPDARRHILGQLQAYGITLLAGEEAVRIESGKLTLETAKSIDTDTVIWTAGLEASPLTQHFKGERDELGRLCLDSCLRLPDHQNVFAAGDVAKVPVDDRHFAVMSCQHAMPQGKFAGHNAVNSLFGKELIPYSQPRYATCLDLGSENALFTVGWEREVKMVGRDAKELKNQIVSQWIYPAQDIEKTIGMSAPEVLA